MITPGTNRKEEPPETAGAGVTAEAIWSVEAVKTKNCIQSNAEMRFEYISKIAGLFIFGLNLNLRLFECLRG